VLEVAAAEDLVLENREPRMRFRRFGDSALEYELVCWVRSPMLVGRARHELNREIYERLQTAGIEIPYPQREVWMRGGAHDRSEASAGRVAPSPPAPDGEPSAGNTD